MSEPSSPTQRALATLPEAPAFLQGALQDEQVRASVDAASRDATYHLALQDKRAQLQALADKIAFWVGEASKPGASPAVCQQCYLLSGMYSHYATALGLATLVDVSSETRRVKLKTTGEVVTERYGIGRILERMFEEFGDGLGDLYDAATFEERTGKLAEGGQEESQTVSAFHRLLEMQQVQMIMLKRMMRFMAERGDPPDDTIFSGADALGVPIADIFAAFDVPMARVAAAHRRKETPAEAVQETMLPLTDQVAAERAKAEAQAELQSRLAQQNPGATP